MEFSEVVDDDWFNYQKHGWYSYKKDQVGTIYQVYDHHAETYTESRTYDVFGKLISKTGNSGCRFGFQSKYYDEESGLNYFYHRYYDPGVGRFINEDPVGFKGGLNLYGFVGGNPINLVDFNGLIPIFPPGQNIIKPPYVNNGDNSLADAIGKTIGRIAQIIYDTVVGMIDDLNPVGPHTKDCRYLKCVDDCMKTVSPSNIAAYLYHYRIYVVSLFGSVSHYVIPNLNVIGQVTSGFGVGVVVDNAYGIGNKVGCELKCIIKLRLGML